MENGKHHAAGPSGFKECNSRAEKKDQSSVTIHSKPVPSCGGLFADLNFRELEEQHD